MRRINFSKQFKMTVLLLLLILPIVYSPTPLAHAKENSITKNNSVNALTQDKPSEPIYQQNRMLDFDTQAGGLHAVSYVKFSTGWSTTYASPSYPAESGNYIAYSTTINSYINFTVPQQSVTMYFDTPSNIGINITAYDQFNQSVVKREVLGPTTLYQVFLYYNGISSVKITTAATNKNLWAIDNLNFENATVLSRQLNFDNLAGGVNAVPYVKLSGWSTTYADANYPAESGNAVAFAYTLPAYINFTVPQKTVSLYFDTPYVTGTGSFNYNLTAYDQFNQPVAQDKIIGPVSLRLITFNYNGISSIKITGSYGASGFWAIDNLYFVNATIVTRQLNFDTLTGGVNAVPYATFSGGWGLTYSSTQFPAESGSWSAFSSTINSYINFTVPQQSVSMYFDTPGAYKYNITAYDQYNQPVLQEAITGPINLQYVSLSYSGIYSIGIICTTASKDHWAIDNLNFENATVLSRELNFDTSAGGLNAVPYVKFSNGWKTAFANSAYPAKSPNYTAYTSTTSSYINFTVPQNFVSMYFDTPQTFKFNITAYDQYNQPVIQRAITGPVNLYYISFNYNGIYSIVITCTPAETAFWGIDNLIFENASIVSRELNFDSLAGKFSSVPYVQPSPGWTVWNTYSSSFQSQSGNYSIYTHETNNYINFTIPQQVVSFDFDSPASGSFFLTAYDQYGQPVINYTITAPTTLQNIRFQYNGIYSLTIRGNFANWQIWTSIDNLNFENATILSYHTLSQPAISSPVNGQSVSGSIAINWKTAIDSLSQTVSYNVSLLDSNNAFIKYLTTFDSIPSFDWNTTSVTNGSYIIKITAFDDSGLSDSSQISVTVNNALPASSTSTATTTTTTTSSSSTNNIPPSSATNSSTSSKSSPGFEAIALILALVIMNSIRVYRKKKK